jgi:hypothetical protein
MSIMTEPEPRRGGRRVGQKDKSPRKPNNSLSGLLTAIKVANAAGFDLSVDKSRVILTPKVPADADDSAE